MQKVKCFYHRSDLDGHCSGAIVYDYYKQYQEVEIEMIGVDYIDMNYQYISIINKDDIVVIVDFSFESIDDMKMIQNNCKEFIWIDHHKTAIEKSEKYNFDKCVGLRRIGNAACELTWEYFFPSHVIPQSVYLLGRYDVWDHEDSRVVPFQYGIRLNNTLPTENIWREILYSGSEGSNFIRNIIKDGELILKYEKSQWDRIAKSNCYVINFEGLRALVINRSHINSKFFESQYDSELHDCLITFSLSGDGWKVSLYCPDDKDFDLSKIALKRGGGGHGKACGFTTNDISELLPGNR